MITKSILTINTPKTCNECPLFVSKFGSPAYCAVKAEYSAKEIANEKDGNLELYYHGCLSKRPISCPLKEVKDD